MYKNKPYLRYILKIDANSLLRRGYDIFVSDKKETDRLECRFLESNDVKKYARKLNLKIVDNLDDYSNETHDFYKIEINNEFQKKVPEKEF